MRLARLLAGAAVGAGLMYLLDPEGGRRRRGLLRDQLVSAAHKTTDAVDATSRDMTNRARGVVAELRGRFSRNDHVSDDVLRERVRARIGSVVGPGGGIETHVADGRVTLRGPVLTETIAPLLRRLREHRVRLLPVGALQIVLHGATGQRREDQERHGESHAAYGNPGTLVPRRCSRSCRGRRRWAGYRPGCCRPGCSRSPRFRGRRGGRTARGPRWRHAGTRTCCSAGSRSFPSGHWPGTQP